MEMVGYFLFEPPLCMSNFQILTVDLLFTENKSDSINFNLIQMHSSCGFLLVVEIMIPSDSNKL